MENLEFLKKIGGKIKEVRREKGISQEELAKMIDTKHTQIGRIERGEVNCTINTLKKVALALDITLVYLVE